MIWPLGRITGLRSWLWLYEIWVMALPSIAIVCRLNTRSRSYSSSAKYFWPSAWLSCDLVWRLDVNTMPWPAGRYTGWMSSLSVDDVRRLNVPPTRPPVVMSYSQIFQWLVQAGTSPIFTALELGQRLENRI